MPTRIEISPENSALEVGKTFGFSASYYDSLGNKVTSTVFDWQSSDDNVAAIDANGLVSGITPGQVHITARANNSASDPALLTVVIDPAQVAKVVVQPDSANLSAGQTVQFTAAAVNLNSETISGKTFTWRSSNTSVATVNNSGLATALAPGSANIIATTDGIDSSPAIVQVAGGVRTGTFVKRPGTSYTVSGTAILDEQTDGSLVLKFGSDFSTSSGPGLYVYLATTNQVGSTSLEVARLKSTRGEQSYDLPATVKIDSYNWAIIHCKPFNVTFGYAELKREP
jgi:uncharacterized protein YjdB